MIGDLIETRAGWTVQPPTDPLCSVLVGAAR
jgi:hypothetical protein